MNNAQLKGSEFMNQEKQYHIDCKMGDIGKFVLLTGDPKRCKDIAKYLDNAKLIADNREFVTYTGYLLGEKVSVMSTGIGGPSAAICLEEAANLGADTFIRIGTCGGMDIEVNSGDLVIAQATVRQEGTSLQYVPIEFPAIANLDIVLTLRESAKELKYKFHLGIIQSKDSFYGQHSPEKMPVSYELLNKWSAWKKVGVLASEMECASLFCVASCRKVRIGAILLCVWNQEKQKAGLENEEVFNTKNAIETAILAMKKLIQSSIVN